MQLNIHGPGLIIYPTVFLILLILKLTKIWNLSWIVVLAPLWAPMLLIFIFILIIKIWSHRR